MLHINLGSWPVVGNLPGSLLLTMEPSPALDYEEPPAVCSFLWRGHCQVLRSTKSTRSTNELGTGNGGLEGFWGYHPRKLLCQFIDRGTRDDHRDHPTKLVFASSSRRTHTGDLDQLPA